MASEAAKKYSVNGTGRSVHKCETVIAPRRTLISHRYGLFECHSGEAFFGRLLPELFERGVDLIDGYKLSVIEHRPVVERTGQGFCLFERVHIDEPRGEPRTLCLHVRMRRFRADDAAKVLGADILRRQIYKFSGHTAALFSRDASGRSSRPDIFRI